MPTSEWDASVSSPNVEKPNVSTSKASIATRAKRPGLLLVALLLTCLGQHAAAGESSLGQLFREEPQARGQLEPSGSPVLDGELVKTLDRAAILRLDNGHVLKLLGNTAVVVEEGRAGDVSLTVLSGRLLQVGAGGRLLVAGQRSTVTLSPTAVDAEDAERQLLRSGGNSELARRRMGREAD
jgi:hypothetical protein